MKNLWKWLWGDTVSPKPRDPTEAEKSAIAQFLVLHPDETIRWTHLTAEEEDRYVVGVFYSDWKPPRYQFFAVEKTTMQAQVIEDDTAYRPKGWR
jgi:hypothetical protein